MLISKNNYPTSCQNFTGIHIANSKNCIKNIETSIDLYEITNKDRAFLKKLRESVKMSELMPDKNISQQGYDRWQEMLNLALDKALNFGQKSIVAVKDNKPCGIITFKPDKRAYKLDCICTWPVEKGKKVTLAGQTLFKQLFEDFLEAKSHFVSLAAILNGPYSVVEKYMRLGFKQTGGENFLVAMRTNQEQVKNTMKYLNDIIITNHTFSTNDINLLEKLEL